MSRLVPQGNSAKKAVQVRHDGHIAGKPSDIDLYGIAPADIEAVVVKHFVEFGDDLDQAIVPQFFSEAFELGATQPVFSDFQNRTWCLCRGSLPTGFSKARSSLRCHKNKLLTGASS